MFHHSSSFLLGRKCAFCPYQAHRIPHGKAPDAFIIGFPPNLCQESWWEREGAEGFSRAGTAPSRSAQTKTACGDISGGLSVREARVRGQAGCPQIAVKLSTGGDYSMAFLAACAISAVAFVMALIVRRKVQAVIHS